MERLLFVHLSGPRQGQVDVLARLPATVGSEPGVDVVVPGIAPVHARLLRQDRGVVLEDADAGHHTLLAGEAVREAVLRDGDVLELGEGGPRLQFRHEGASRPTPTAWPAPDRAPRPSFTGAYARAVVREAMAHTSRASRAGLTLLSLVAFGTLGWSLWESHRLQAQVDRLRDAIREAEDERRRFEARVAEEREKAEDERLSLEARIEESRGREETLLRQLAEAASGEVKELRTELATTRRRLAGLERERAMGERIIRDYGAGVCLIQGSYAYYDASGRPLRYQVDDAGRTKRSDEDSLSLSVEATGPIHTEDYFGTGFLVDRRGYVLTNRHVAQPWWKDDQAQAILKEGFEPRVVRFRAFFPRMRGPHPLTLLRVAENADLALLAVELEDRRVPVLPLDTTGRGAVAGQPVIVVGYPTGLEAILAKADPSEVRTILEKQGTQSERVTEALSHRGLIRPSTSQGHIGDITSTDIVFDAPTTQGGSGGPVFNRNGRVIAVEYAVLQKFGGHSFGLPIRYAVDLLKEPRKR